MVEEYIAFGVGEDIIQHGSGAEFLITGMMDIGLDGMSSGPFIRGGGIPITIVITDHIEIMDR